MCDVCKQNPCNPRCPNYVSEKVTHYCSICGEGIYSGEEYIENDNGEVRHYDCFQGIKELLDWLGCKVKTMDDIN